MKASMKALDLIRALKAVVSLSALFLSSEDYQKVLDALAVIEIIFSKAAARSLLVGERSRHEGEECVDMIYLDPENDEGKTVAWWVDQDF